MLLTNTFKMLRRQLVLDYLHPLFTATEHPSVCEFQSFFGSGTFLPFILQTAEVAFIDGKRLKSLLWSQVTL